MVAGWTVYGKRELELIQVISVLSAMWWWRYGFCVAQHGVRWGLEMKVVSFVSGISVSLFVAASTTPHS